MIEVQLFIPMADNDGRAFDSFHDAEFLDLIALEFGGCSVMPGVVDGRWFDETGLIYRDQLRIVAFSVPGMIALGPAILGVAEFAKEHYRQEAVYIRYLGNTEII